MNSLLNIYNLVAKVVLGDICKCRLLKRKQMRTNEKQLLAKTFLLSA